MSIAALLETDVLRQAFEMSTREGGRGWVDWERRRELADLREFDGEVDDN